jgi:hypothetical protein
LPEEVLQLTLVSVGWQRADEDLEITFVLHGVADIPIIEVLLRLSLVVVLVVG